MNNEHQIVIVVGNRFADFGNVGTTIIITIAALLDALDHKGAQPITAEVHYIPGQGLSRNDIETVVQKARLRQLEPWFLTWEAKARQPKASSTLSHKVQAQNILISAPRRIDKDHFEIDLDIDDESELMLDHVTGKHVQGMVLIEACRQAVMAMIGKFYLSDSAIKYYFVVHHLETKFGAFVFPTPAKIVGTILEAELGDPARLKFNTHGAVIQNGVTATEVSIKATAFPEEIILSKETYLAKKCIADVREEVAQRLLALQNQEDPDARYADADAVLG